MFRVRVLLECAESHQNARDETRENASIFLRDAKNWEQDEQPRRTRSR